MRYTIYIQFCVLLTMILTSNAQDNTHNPYESIGKKAEILTLSDGLYHEFFDTDSIEIIGSAVLNTNTMRVVGFVEYDTMYSEATLEPEVVSRWLSPDPLAKKFPDVSPYVFSFNNPIIYIDQDGAEPREANKVLNVDIHKAYITKIASNVSGFGRNIDKSLFSTANDEYLTHDPQMTIFNNPFSGIPKLLGHAVGLGTLDEDIRLMERADAWIDAARSVGGYEYTEEIKGGQIDRKVENFGEGYENIVTSKSTYEINECGENKLVSEEEWIVGDLNDDGGRNYQKYEKNLDTEDWNLVEEGILEPEKYEPENKP